MVAFSISVAKGSAMATHEQLMLSPSFSLFSSAYVLCICFSLSLSLSLLQKHAHTGIHAQTHAPISRRKTNVEFFGYSIGCVVLYTAQQRFHKSTTETLEYVVNQADTTVDKLRTVSDFIASAKLIGVDQVFLPSNVQTDIDQIGIRINSSASVVADKTVDNSDDIRDLLDSV